VGDKKRYNSKGRLGFDIERLFSPKGRKEEQL
jgi:hypothetical protein